MVKIDWLSQPHIPINYLLGSLTICMVLAETSPALAKSGDIGDTKRPPKPAATHPGQFATWPIANRDRAASPTDTAQLPPTLPLDVIKVETLTPTPVGFATAANPLQGTKSQSINDADTPLPAIAPRDLETPAASLSDGVAAPEARETEAFEIEDYVPEPEPTTIVQASAEVGTTPDELVEWRATIWGGVMTDNDLIDSVTFQDIELEDSGLVGIGISRRVGGGNTIKVEGELQLFRHFGRQNHFEGTAALAVRWELSPSFSIALIEGLSYATALPEIEDENNTDESQFLNYLALEFEYSYTPDWAIAARLHHRSGAYEQFSDAVGGSNAYLFGLRRRF